MTGSCASLNGSVPFSNYQPCHWTWATGAPSFIVIDVIYASGVYEVAGGSVGTDDPLTCVDGVITGTHTTDFNGGCVFPGTITFG